MSSNADLDALRAEIREGILEQDRERRFVKEGKLPSEAVPEGRREIPPPPRNDLDRIIRELCAVLDAGTAMVPLAEFPPNESGQAQALGHYLNGRGLKYSPARGWLAYDREHGLWRADFGEAAAVGAADHLARARSDLREVQGDRKQHESFARVAPSARSIGAVLSLLKHRPTVRELDASFNPDPYLLNCHGIAVDLRRGLSSARPSRPEDMLTMEAGFVPEEGSTEVFDAFLRQFSLGREDLSAFLLRFLGMALSGDMSAGVFLNLWGGGRNGKGALLRLMLRVFGSYAIAVSPAVVVDDGRSVGGPHPEQCDLDGPRLLIADEIPSGKLNIENVKRLTGGGDRFRAARKFKDDYEFTPNGKLVIASNTRLALPRVDVALTRRYRLFPCEYTIPPGQEDHGLEARLAAEGPAILARLITEAGEYFADGGGPKALPYSPTIEAASAAYLADEDVLGRFIAERCELIGSARAAELYQAFARWAEAEGIRPLSARALGEALLSKGYEKRRIATGMTYLGISLRGAE